jgi:hypothetical protein
VGGSRRRRSLIWLIMPEKYSGETSLGRRNPDLFDEPRRAATRVKEYDKVVVSF